MAIEGTLDLFPLPDILQLISHQGKTGILTVQGQHDILAISFERGRVVAADALNQTLEEALGEVLAGHGLVAPADFAAVSALHRTGRGRLVDLLVEGGYIDRAQVLGALRLHVYRLLIELLGWRQGEFKFYSGDEVTFEEGFQPISVEELLIRSVEEAAGDDHPTIPDSRALYQAADLAGRTLRIRRDDEPAPSPRPGEIWLGEADRLVLGELSEGATVADLLGATGFDEYKIRYVLHRLLELGVVERKPLPRPDQVEVDAEAGGEETVVEPLAEELPANKGSRAPVRPPTRTRASASIPVWGGRALAALSLCLFVWAVLSRSWQMLVPFPWQESAREAIAKDLAFASFRRIEHAAKTDFLLSGRFPEDLGRLVDRKLLSPREELDPLGEPWRWKAFDGSYEVSGAGMNAGETVSENYLLDPLFSTRAQNDEAPLILLD